MLVQEQFGEREVTVFLPPSYPMGDRCFPVVYVQDGGHIVKGCLNLLHHMAMTKTIEEIIYVGIETTNRSAEYTPWASKAVSSGRENFGGEGNRYLEEIVQEIKPQIDAKYRTLPEPRNTGIAGYSLGGLIALHALYEYPGIFGKYAILSPSLWFEDFLETMQHRQIPSAYRQQQKIYLYVGEKEGIYKQNDQKKMFVNNQQAYTILQDQGYNETCLRFIVDTEGTHDAVFFMQYFPKAMQWLFGNR